MYEGDRARKREDLRALDEERPKLAEEERETLVHFDLRPVRLDLRKVGVEGEVGSQIRGHPGPQGENVTFESEVVMTDDGFDEVGTITYAGRGSLKFKIVGTGHMAPSAVSGVNHGSIIWSITEGDGEFSGATGLITSNFTFSEQGDVVDNEYVRIYTP